MDGTTTINKIVRSSLVLFVILSEILSLEITRLTVPRFVLNGTEESVLLDCEYDYNPEQDKRLIIKWFHNDNPRPVYQWIPELNQRLFNENFHIDEDYEISPGTKYTRFRAMSMYRLTTEQSGVYSCFVISLTGQDNQEETMIVYALPSSVNLNYTIQGGVVKVTCEVEGVYPLPEMTLFKVEPGEVDPNPIEEDELDYDLQDGAYSVQLSTNISEMELASEGLTFFGCQVTMNGTGYEKSIQVPYFPDPIAEKQEGDDSDNDGTAVQTGAVAVIVTLLNLLFLLT